jgi:hypothetical protein
MLDPLDMLSRITKSSKPDAELGPAMATAVNTVSQRLRKETQ